jgi:hypothetical protein
MEARTEMIDYSTISGYAVSGVFGVFGVVQLATEDMTGIGMLMIAAYSAYSTHIAKLEKAKGDVLRAENERERLRIEEDSLKREAGLMARIKLLVRQIPCDHDACPVIQVARGDIAPLESIRITEDVLHPEKKPTKPEDDTVDVP